MRELSWGAVFFMGALGCGSSSSGSGGDAGNGEFLGWKGSNNGAVVLDANGNRFVFDTSNGCMFSATTMVGPSGFCLAASSSSPSGYASYGPTNCSNPASNSDCNAATFDVLSTDDPGGPGCIAVLGNGASEVETVTPLAVTSTASTFAIQTTATPGAYKAYWNGFIPWCGGSNPYAGSYTSTTTSAKPLGYVVQGASCVLPTSSNVPTQNGGAPFLTVTIDSGGIIDSESLHVTGTISATGTGTFTAAAVGAATGASCVPTFTITGASRTGGKWVLVGTESFAATTFPLSLTQD